MKQYRESRQKQLDTVQIAHGLDGYVNWNCRCEVCRRAHTSAVEPAAKRWRKRNRQAIGERDSRRFATAQEQTRETASRHYCQWTGPELELAAREDLSAREVAVMIGRTLAAVQYMRRRLKDDPKTVNLAGIARDPSTGSVRPDEEPNSDAERPVVGVRQTKETP
jgi:hypothetical protein